MTFLSLLPFIASLPVNAASRLVTTEQVQKPLFHFQVTQNEYTSSISSKGLQSYIELGALEQDYTAPFQIKVVSMNDKNSNITFTIQHQYQVQLQCTTLEYTYWTESISLYEEDRIFVPNEQDFIERQEATNINLFDSFLSYEDIHRSCDMEVAQSVYTIKQGEKIIKEIILIPELEYQ